MPRAKKNLKELRKAVENCEPARKELGLKLVEQLEFMESTLNEYQERIKKDGAIIEGVNGNGFTVKSEHPASKAYTALIGRFNQMAKTVEDIVIGDDKSTQNDELIDFITGGKAGGKK